MKRSLVAILAAVIFSRLAIAQVDTLQFEEIGQIQAPSEITNLYIQDLDGDSLKEIILTTASNVHIYNGITCEPIWTSPELINPRYLLFADIDDNGLADISVKDDEHIFIFNPSADREIWVSPTLQFDTYRCYTIGRLETEDDWPDVLIVTKQPFQRVGLDTVWIDGFAGPAYDDYYQFITYVLDVNTFDDGYYWISREQPSNIISAGSIDRSLGWNRLFMFTDWFREEGYFEPDGPIEWMRQLYYGKVKYFDTANNNEIGSWSVGRVLGYGTSELGNARLIYMISEKRHFFDSQELSFDERVKYLNFFSADSLIASDTLWAGQNQDWQGFIVDDLNYEMPGDEFGYASGDTLYLYAFPDMNPGYIARSVPGMDEIKFAYRSLSYFEMPQILCSNTENDYSFILIDGADGNLTVVYTGQHRDVDWVSDMDVDGNDEILSINDDMLYILGLQRTAVDDDIQKPNLRLLSANYPNPFNSSTTIEYNLPEAREVTVEIYDLLGRKVTTLIEGEQEAGDHNIIWNAESQSSGVYFYRIKAGEFNRTRRTVLLK